MPFNKTYMPVVVPDFETVYQQDVDEKDDVMESQQSLLEERYDLGVTVTFEGPETESQVDRQMDMLAAALSRQPDAIGFADGRLAAGGFADGQVPDRNSGLAFFFTYL